MTSPNPRIRCIGYRRQTLISSIQK